MFKRRKPLTLLQHARELFWPTMGWRRAFRYVHLRVARMSDSTHRIAAGFAVGASVAFTPIIGTHFIQAALVAWIFRLNLLAALIGTWVANPWTIPFMWWGSIKLGAFLFSFLGVQAKTELPHDMDFHVFWDLLTHHPVSILLPWLTGGYLMALLVFPLSYYVFYKLVHGTKLARKKVQIHNVHKVAREVTGQTR
ncbi:MAG: DUF2062 domain-containing protein [Alphaproteobacteria bacterium PRO2]|nr:DUF2062 domain-containing protein [Alphaproteobacteria bacterium PRO2]